MKTADIIISIIFAIAIFGPFVLLHFLGKMRSEKMMAALKDFASSIHLTIIQHDIWEDKALGYDPNKQILVFISAQAGKYIKRSINLSRANNFELISSQELVEVRMKRNNTTLESLVLYDSLFDTPMEAGFHVILAKKWIGLLTKSIPQNNIPLKAA